MELTIRKLRRHGVEVVSMTQPTGTDPSQEMMRQIIGVAGAFQHRLKHRPPIVGRAGAGLNVLTGDRPPV